jgi:hypothetical protein
MINRDSVRRYEILRPARGRPFPPVRAWKELLSAHVESLDDVRELAVMCRRRAQRMDVRIIPGLFDRVRTDSRVVLSGVDAARFHGGAVSVMPPLDFYVRSEHYESFKEDFVAGIDSADSNCIARIIDVTPSLDIHIGQYMPLIVALVDLIAEGDYRSANEAFKCLEVQNVDNTVGSS